MARHRGRVLSREQLIEQVWGYDYYGDERVVDVHMGRLRKKIGDDAAVIISVFTAGRIVGPIQAMMRASQSIADGNYHERVEAGQIPLDLEPVMLADLVISAAERLTLQFEDKGVGLETEVGTGPLPVRVDANRITQVLANLLGNALQYTPTGGRVTVRTWAEGREARVSIHDTGIGIPPEHLPHVFERFYRVDKSRSRAGGGSGIGLTIARHLVEAHGGHIWAASEGAGNGATFTVALPLAA